MTLFKQMGIALSMLILIILASVMILNYQAAKRDLIESLYQMTVNNIASLSTTLESSANKSAIMKSIINAQPANVKSLEDKTPAIVKSIIHAALHSAYHTPTPPPTDTDPSKHTDQDDKHGSTHGFDLCCTMNTHKHYATAVRRCAQQEQR